MESLIIIGKTLYQWMMMDTKGAPGWLSLKDGRLPDLKVMNLEITQINKEPIKINNGH